MLKVRSLGSDIDGDGDAGADADAEREKGVDGWGMRAGVTWVEIGAIGRT